ncbi:MAG: UDP-N-acetylglucosamine 4,6-dehydratase (inverting) [Acidimicrobiaceae bacterium]|nr:UDP-N-acetylglucosamine 4,6-dehydratase (inverting) [Acidimicrobiaceae bacterium]|tara:strand:+ start:3485 stop:4480 length:996 start_codon:yes stop_codon:yes gene_type:complete
MINNSCIFVSGGTGSFGKMFVNYIIKNFKPKKLIIYSRDELKQMQMKDELNSKKKYLRFFIGDIRDEDRLEIALQGVDYVFHAAAMKQVDTSEYNPTECINTNIHGTNNLIKASQKNNVKKFISLSTDKAVNPINLYGATKLAADKLVVAANNMYSNKLTRFSVVRYGNVINSRGSVIPYFKELLKNGAKHLPLTDKKMTRFWITLDQSAVFVLRCLKLMRGGEVFVPKIPSSKVYDVCKAIDKKINIKLIGKRPGEKLNETLCSKEMSFNTIEFKNYFVVTPGIEFFDGNINYLLSKENEKGKKVRENFEYSSDNNKQILSIKSLRKLIT